MCPGCNLSGDDCIITHVAFNPEVLESFGKRCKNKDEQDALIQLAISYLNDQNKIKLSTNFTLLDADYKSCDPNSTEDESIRLAFGLEKNPLAKELEKLGKTFAPVAHITARDPHLIDQISSDGKINPISVERENPEPSIKIPGMRRCQTAVCTCGVWNVKSVNGAVCPKAGFL